MNFCEDTRPDKIRDISVDTKKFTAINVHQCNLVRNVSFDRQQKL